MKTDIATLFTVINFSKFGNRLEALRKSRNLTQNRLCLKSGILKNSISAYECHKRSPTKNTVRKLAIGLSVSVSVLEDQDSFQKASDDLSNFNSSNGEFYLYRQE